MNDILTSSDNPIARWDKRYLELARHFASWSKDPNTKVGAVVIGEQGEILAQGYNGFPRGVVDEPTRMEDRDVKLKFVVHAELNCIYNAGYNGVSLKGATLYVCGLPVCNECAKGIIQSGIKRVVMYYPAGDYNPAWNASFYYSSQMFKEAGVVFARYVY